MWTPRVDCYIGPVHATYLRDDGLKSVLVPFPEDPSRLVWTDIWRLEDAQGQFNLRGTWYCHIVPMETVRDWMCDGWDNEFTPLMENGVVIGAL
jgi:hypothetical protein